MPAIRGISRKFRTGIVVLIACFLLVLYFGSLDSFLPLAQPVATTVAASANTSTRQHPVAKLVGAAQGRFEEIKQGQSKSLGQAVKEYRTRYGLPPPPQFDKWYEFATRNGVVLIDEFDNIHQSMMPFWGLAPETIRERVAEALKSGDNLMRVVVKDGNITDVEGGPGWMQDAVRGMMDKFVQHLPSMEIAFNTIDEPRIVVPHDNLQRFLARARVKSMPAASSNRSPLNSFSSHSPEPEKKTKTDTKMNTISFAQLGRSPSWQHLRLGCRPDSPTGALADSDAEDDVTSYAEGELGFVHNASAMSDVCLSPSLHASHGFFDRPDTHSVSYDLVPVFSQSKTSVNNDILYPSPWYWVDMVRYDAASDMPWAEKQRTLYWRGSTTGGFATGGNWRRHHRQRFVDLLNGNGSAAGAVLSRHEDGDDGGWTVRTVERETYRSLVDVGFTRVVQCEEADCEAQAAHFGLRPAASAQAGWRSRLVLDMDGNAFSGRFYALLRSRSLTLKLAAFREWHAEWLRPWVHYAPLSLQGGEWLELVRYFSEDGGGEAEAERMAAAGTDWAERVLRKEDMEAWFFRLLLEYGRVIDDQREDIGFTLGFNRQR